MPTKPRSKETPSEQLARLRKFLEKQPYEFPEGNVVDQAIDLVKDLVEVLAYRDRRIARMNIQLDAFLKEPIFTTQAERDTKYTKVYDGQS